MMRNVLAVLAGFVASLVVNGGLITLSPMLIPPPAGVDVTNTESLKQSIHLFEAKHFIMPFLAHALGTLAGALVAYRMSRKPVLAYVMGGLGLLGGVIAALLIPAPGWFIALDLIGAYIPMAWLATQIGGRPKDARAAMAM
jgi:hypothetical protein